MVPQEPQRRGALHLLGWLVGGVLIGWVAAMGMMMLSVAIGMAFVVGLDLDQAWGVPVYIAVFAFGVAGYATLVTWSITEAGKRTYVPKLVWPALGVFPTYWGVLSAVARPRGVVQPTVTYFALAGLALAWLLQRRPRRHRLSAGAASS